MRWLLTYADMITLLMLFFIVLYSISQMDKARYIQLVRAVRASLLNANVSNSILDASQVPAPTNDLLPGSAGDGLERQDPFEGLPFEQAELLDLERVGQELAQALAEAGLTGRVNVVLAERGLVISFADSVFFDLGKAHLRPEARDLLIRLTKVLARLQNKVVVEGHTDNLPIHTAEFPSNWELSVARAVAVARFLTEAGGIDPRRVAATGYGEWRPRYPNDSEANRAKNRRVDIVLLREAFGRGDEVREVITPAGPEPQLRAAPPAGAPAGAGADTRGRSGPAAPASPR